MGKTILQTNFTKGINRDIHPRFQPVGTYRHARNKKKSTAKYYSGGLVNELQNLFAGEIPGTIVGFHRIEERNSTLFFHIDGGSSLSIWNHNTNEVKHVVTDKEFGCDWGFSKCQWIGYGHSDSKTLAPCSDLIIYFCSGRNAYRVNVDELLDSKRRESIKKQEEPCEYFRIFKRNSNPRVDIKPNRGGGRDLVPGQYFAVVRGLDESGNTSNWGTIEGPAFIGSKYNLPTDKSNQSLRIRVKSLSKEYSRVQIAVIPPVGSQEADLAYIIYDGSYNTNGVTVDYYSSFQHKSIVPLVEILGKNIKFLRPENLIIDDGKLHLYRCLKEFNPKVQKWAQQAKFYAIAYAVPSSAAHRFRSLPRDEVKAFGLGWQHQDATWTAIGHTPGPQAAANELQCGQCDLPLGHTSNNAKLVETYNTVKGSKEEICHTPGKQVTRWELENVDHPPVGGCEEPPLEFRSVEPDDCVEHQAEKEAVEAKVESVVSTNDSINDCLDCAKATTDPDLDQAEGMLINSTEQFTDLLRTDHEVATDCLTDTHETLPEAATTAYDEVIEHAEKDEEIKFRTVIKRTGGGATSVSGDTGELFVFGVNKGEDCITDEVEPIILSKWEFGGWESSLTYPETLDCGGEPLYGDLAGKPIRHHKVPDAAKIPLFYSYQNGVENRFDPSNIPGKDTYVVMIGLMVEKVYIPSYEKGEIAKPLDENVPFGVFMAKTEPHNKTVLHHMYVTNTFKGKIGNKEYAVPRHGANGYPHLDRSIDDDGSHIGEVWNENIYNGHSPELAMGAEFINGDYIKVEARLSGNGWVYGQYVEGKHVPDEDFRLDRRVQRGALNFTTWESLNFQTCLKGAEYAEFNTNLQNPQGIDRPLLNKFRESSIYFQTADPLPNVGMEGKDYSLNVGGLDHEYPTDGEVLYCTLKRFNSQQYGSIEALQYVHTGLEGRKGETTARGLVGDSFVQKWSHKRTSYISDKVGNFINVDFPKTADPEFLGPDSAHQGKDRGVCDPPNRRGYRMKEFLGFWNSSELPQNGDKKDPKNMANAHPTRHAEGPDGIRAWVAAGNNVETDWFYPRLHVQLNHFHIESDINLYYRSTNLPATRDIYYEQLQGVDVDPSINKVDPQDAWLCDFHNEQRQPTKKQQRKKAMIRTFLVIGGPALFAEMLAKISTALQAGNTMWTSPFFGSTWLMLVYNILSGKKLDKFLGIPECKTDEEGAQGENNLRGLRDNWNDYNYGFSAVNDQNTLIGMPANYNTCVCDAVSNNIYSSNKQIDSSPYDAFLNFQALSNFSLTGDSGQIQRLFIWGDRLYAQTTDGLYPLQAKQPSIPTSGGSLTLGESSFYNNPPRVQDGAIEGFKGTEHPNASMGCKYGIPMVDYEARELCLFDGGFNTLTGRDSGLYHFWKDNITFCNTSDCKDAMQPGGIHYTFGYDPEYELMLITKHDGDKGFTYSYDLVGKNFISEHDFVPDFYFWDRNKLYMVKDSKIYRANMGGAFSTYFGKAYPSEVDIVVRADSGEQFTHEHTTLDTEVSKGNLYDREETYHYMTVYNQFQTTGRMQIIPEESNEPIEATQDVDYVRPSRRVLGKWKLDNIKSREIDRDVPVSIDPTCSTNEEPNEGNVTNENNSHTEKSIKGKWLRYKFEFNKNDREIVLFGMNTHVSIPEEK